jgi:hypothetical protein
MAKYLLLKHYRGGPAPVSDVPMDQWTPEEFSAHMQYMHDFAARLEGTGEFVDSQALSPEGTFVRYDGEGRPPVTDGPFAETKDLIAGWMVIDVETYERALRAGRRAVRGSGCGREAAARVARGAPVPPPGRGAADCRAVVCIPREDRPRRSLDRSREALRPAR